MTIEEIVDLLTVIALRDNRQVSKGTALVWHEDVGDLDFADCREAVGRHFRESTDWLMPAHVRNHVKTIRAERLANSDLAIPPVDPANEADYRDALKHIQRRIGDGIVPFKAITGGTGSEPTEEFHERRDELAERRSSQALNRARDLDPDGPRADACQCGTLLDPDGSCFACNTEEGAS